ncbi:MAG TPA: SGNH/GDSL hydrolase family protein [Pirellulales bacterium]|nr:SGNH/GDSL hydrolase family protein [Pirellulales bacterium]
MIETNSVRAAIRWRSFHGRLLKTLAAGLTLFTSAICCATADASQLTIGALGDSLTDEYAYNGRGYAQNWVEQLVNYAGVNFGPLGSYAAPRNQGYAYNWARSGATSSSMISGGQVSGLAAQIPSAGIQYVTIDIGTNDFSPGGTAFNNIYNGTWSSTQITNYIDQVATNISTAISAEQNAGAKVVVATVGNYGLVPGVAAVFPDSAGLQRLTNAISQVNAGIMSTAQTDHIAVVNYDLLAQVLFASGIASNGSVLIGNVPIFLNQNTSTNPSQAAFVSDGIHPNTAIQGLVANLFMQALNTGYNAGAPLFTEAQLLAHQGLAYGGSDTLAAQIGSYSNYIVNFVPEPSAVVLAALGIGAMLIVVARPSRQSV